MCNFRCRFCHNHRLVHEWKKLEIIPEKTVFDFLKENKQWIDGVTVTGGEPTIHDDRLYNFIKKVKKHGFPVKLDTNGMYPDIVKKLVDDNLVDYIAMDIKTALSDKKYEKITDVSNSVKYVKKTIDIIVGSGIDHEFRTTVVPGYVSKEDVLSISKYLSSANRYVLQQFNPKETLDPALRKVKPYSNDIMKEMAHSASKYVKTTMRLK